MLDSSPAPAGSGANSGHGDEQTVVAICQRHGNQPGALIEILHDVQEAFGFVPEAMLPVVAHAVNLSRAEVYGVFTFYHDFRKQAAGKHVLKLCRAEACQAMGADRLAAAMSTSLGVGFGQTSDDGAVTLEAVYCLGNCALAPAAMLDGRLIGKASEAGLLQAMSARKPGRP